MRVWDGDYCSVWHLNNYRDSTLNGNNGENHGTDDCIGKIGEGKDFVETNHDYLSFGDMQEPADGSISTATFEAWINPDSLVKTIPIICKLDTIYEPDKRAYKFEILRDGEIRLSVQSGTWYHDDRIIRFTTDDGLVNCDSWSHIVVAVDLSNGYAEIYHNGELKDSNIIRLGQSPTHFYDIDLEERVGYLAQESGSVYYDGSMDELRISKICRSEEWIKTQYDNQNDPSMFINVGPEESI